MLALVAVTADGAVATRASVRARATLACLGAFTIWSFCSIAWAGVKGDAWDGANRTLLYLAVYALFTLLPWSLGPASVTLARDRASRSKHEPRRPSAG